MIGAPINDRTCMGSISDVLRGRVAGGDTELQAIAAQHTTTESLANWIRTLPQRDDLGDMEDGPRVKACRPSQRLRVPATNPNCVERAALYVAVAELIDPVPLRQLATVDTPAGLHTIPVEEGVVIDLNPTAVRNCVDCGMVPVHVAPVAISPHEALDTLIALAEEGAPEVRNGLGQVQTGKVVINRLVAEGKPPTTKEEVDATALVLALAQNVAERYGERMLTVMQATARAVADLCKELLLRKQRNWSIGIGGYRLRPAKWLSSVGESVARIGVGFGLPIAEAQLLSMGVPPSLLGGVIRELRAAGIDLPEPSAASPARKEPIT